MLRQAYCDQGYPRGGSYNTFPQGGIGNFQENGYKNGIVGKQQQNQPKYPQLGDYGYSGISNSLLSQLQDPNLGQFYDISSQGYAPFHAPQVGAQFDLMAHTNGALDIDALSGKQQLGWGGQNLLQNGLKDGRNRRSRNEFFNVKSSSQMTDQSHTSGSTWVNNSPPSGKRSVSRQDEQISETLMQELIYRLQHRENSNKVQEVTERFVQFASSRTVSMLLRTLHKQGQTAQALRLFDWLRSFTNETSPQYTLCDVFTYTAAISLCVNQLQYDKSIQLSREMSQRRIQKNVYTYTALMNVCIKCGQLNAALDVYKEMAENKCTLNVVTYNTLIDVYGKLGKYEEALKIFDKMSQEGVEPVTRTYNTLMIACNTSNNWQETLKVYNKMLQLGHTPNTTTYNALITAYSKAQRLEKVLEIYQEMLNKGCERSVITYSSLINACEKAGQWELALYVFNEMRCLGCSPNLITFNSIIAACSQGGQFQKAEELLESMRQEGCKPDVVTYTSLIRTYEKAGNYCGAYEKFMEMQRAGIRPDAIAYIAIIEALYESGVVLCQLHAANLYREAIQKKVIQPPFTIIDDACKLVMSTSSAPLAMLNFYCSLADLREKALKGIKPAEAIGAHSFAIMVSKVKGKEYGENVLKECLQNILQSSNTPFNVDNRPSTGKLQINGLINGVSSGYNMIDQKPNKAEGNSATEIWECSSEDLCNWLVNDGLMFQVFSEGSCRSATLNTQQEYDNIVECQNVMDAIMNFEISHFLNLQNMGATYVNQRGQLLNKALKLFGENNLAEEEVIHDGMLLLDRAISSPDLELDEELLELAIVTSVYVALKLSLKKIPTIEQIAEVVGFPIVAIQQMEQSICTALNSDTSTVCALRNLKVLLERLGMQYSDKMDNWILYGGNMAHKLVSLSQQDSNFLNYRPSIVASACIFSERLNKGLFPFWPSALRTMTKYSHVKSQEFISALASIKNAQSEN